MRTTPNIDEDVLDAAKELARRQRKAASELMREALRNRAMRNSTTSRGRHGFRPIPAGQSPVANELVNDIRDELGV